MIGYTPLNKLPHEVVYDDALRRKVRSELRSMRV